MIGEMTQSVWVGVAFWLFVATVVVAFLWFINNQAKEAQKTIRLAIEKGVPPEKIQMQKREEDIMGFIIGGTITTAVGIGLQIMGFLFGQSNPKAFIPLVGPGILVLLVGISLLVCAWVVNRKQKNRDQ